VDAVGVDGCHMKEREESIPKYIQWKFSLQMSGCHIVSYKVGKVYEGTWNIQSNKVLPLEHISSKKPERKLVFVLTLTATMVCKSAI
jgi:hypothetical protein